MTARSPGDRGGGAGIVDEEGPDGPAPEPPPDPTPPDPPPRPPRNWDAIGGSAGVIGALVAVVGLVVALLAWLAPRSPDPPSTEPPPADPAAADLRVVSATLGRLQEIGYDPTSAAEMGVPLPADAVQDQVVDVELENRGQAPVLIEKIAARVLQNDPLDYCPAVGGGLTPDTLYDLRIPASPGLLDPVEFVRPFQVAPKEFDRLAISIGPYGTTLPYIHTVQLDAVLAGDGRRVDLGTFSLVNPTSTIGLFAAQPYSGDDRQAECIRRNDERLRRAVGYGGIVAPALQQLADRMAIGVARLDAGRPLVSPGGEADRPAADELPRCRAAGLPTVLTWETRADVTGDQRVDAFLGRACAEEGSPVELSFHDGIDPGRAQVLLGPDDGLDPRGLHSARVRVGSGGEVRATGSAYLPDDPTGEPTVDTIDTFAWTGTGLRRTGERQCEQWQGGDDMVPVPCPEG